MYSSCHEWFVIPRRLILEFPIPSPDQAKPTLVKTEEQPQNVSYARAGTRTMHSPIASRFYTTIWRTRGPGKLILGARFCYWWLPKYHCQKCKGSQRNYIRQQKEIRSQYEGLGILHGIFIRRRRMRRSIGRRIWSIVASATTPSGVCRNTGSVSILRHFFGAPPVAASSNHAE